LPSRKNWAFTREIEMPEAVETNTKTEGLKAATPARNSAARLAAVQALYLLDYTSMPREAALRDFVQGKMPTDMDAPPLPDFDEALFSRILHETLKQQADIDGMLRGALDPKWPLERLEKILAAILRAGVAELMAGSETDSAIIINDYMNVAHGFFGGKEPALVNAVLDKLAKTLRS
jgi:N utilization substance protein B